MKNRCRPLFLFRSLPLLILIAVGVVFAAQSAKPTSSTVAKPSPCTLLRYLEKNAARLPRSAVDRYLLQLTDLQSQSLKLYEKQVFADPLNQQINQYTVADLSRLRIRETALKNLAGRILEDGLRFSTSEGMIYPEIDYPRLSNRFGKYASNQVSGYLKIMARETEEHYNEDNGLQISLPELSDRLVAIERFSAADPGFSRCAALQKLGREYLQAYLIGMNNSPAFDYATLHLKEEFLRNFQAVMAAYPGTKLAALTRNYLQILDRAGYRRDQTVLDFAAKAGGEI